MNAWEAQRHLEGEVKVVPAQPAFPASWADKGGQQRETRRRSHRKHRGHRHVRNTVEREQSASLHLKVQTKNVPARLLLPRADKQHRCHRVSRKEGPGCQTLSRQKGCADSHRPCASSRGAVALSTTGGPHEGPPRSSCHSARVRARRPAVSTVERLSQERQDNRMPPLQSRPYLCPAGTGQYGLGEEELWFPRPFLPATPERGCVRHAPWFRKKWD